jgi:hypothetical protein
LLKTPSISAFPTGLLAFVTVLCLGCTASIPASAAERITLANGFDLICNHHAMVDGRIRVFPRAADETDYMELNPEDVTGFEVVPDPPVEQKADGGDVTKHSATPADRNKTDARLTATDMHQLLSKAGAEHNVDADLLASVVTAESGGYVRATSRAGARGLMQLMPGTAQQLGVTDSFAPDENVRGGTTYLDWLLTRYHDNIALALAAYNAGPLAVDRYHGIPPYHETRLYVARVMHEFNRRIAAREKTLASTGRASGVSMPTGPAEDERVGRD